MRRTNIVAATVLIVCGLIYGYLTSRLPARSLPHTPDPSFFPWIVTVVVLALSTVLLIQGLTAEREAPAPASAPAPDLTERRRAVMPGVWALAAFVVYLAALPGLGFLIATAPFFTALMVLYGERRPLRVGLGAIAMTALLYVLFRHGFSVFLPRGLLAGIVA